MRYASPRIVDGEETTEISPDATESNLRGLYRLGKVIVPELEGETQKRAFQRALKGEPPPPPEDAEDAEPEAEAEAAAEPAEAEETPSADAEPATEAETPEPAPKQAAKKDGDAS